RCRRDRPGRHESLDGPPRGGGRTLAWQAGDRHQHGHLLARPACERHPGAQGGLRPAARRLLSCPSSSRKLLYCFGASAGEVAGAGCVAGAVAAGGDDGVSSPGSGTTYHAAASARTSAAITITVRLFVMGDPSLIRAAHVAASSKAGRGST